jgi:osmotically-inducible protein OsmY
MHSTKYRAKYLNTLLAAGCAASFIVLGSVNAAAPDQEDRTAGQVVDDSVVTGKVKSALIADERTKAYQINVTTREGVVHLHGTVDSPAAKAAATQVAQSIAGVRKVQNELVAKS